MDRDIIRKASRVSTNGTFKDWQRDFVKPLYEQARAAHGDPVRMTVVQMDLARHIYPLQDIRREQADECRKAKSDMALAARAGDHEQAASFENDVRYHDTMRVAAAFTIRQLREIGDMLAWRTLRNRMAIRLMAQKQPPGDLPPKDHYIDTMKSAAAAADELRAFPLFTDLTNLLRHGDALYVPFDGSMRITIDELKGASGGDWRRHQRQQEAMSQFVALMGAGSGPFAGDRYHLRLCRIPLRHHFDEMRALIAKARKDGIVRARLTRNHAVFVTDMTDEDRFLKAVAAAPTGPDMSELLQAQPHDDVVDAGLIYRIEDAMLPAAPWGVYPFPDDVRLDLASLRLLCGSSVNVSGFLRDCGVAGMPAELVTDPKHGYAGIRADLGRGIKNEMDLTFLGVRVGVEFVDEGVLVDLLRNPVMPPPPPGEKVMFEFTDEQTLWD